MWETFHKSKTETAAFNHATVTPETRDFVNFCVLGWYGRCSGTAQPRHAGLPASLSSGAARGRLSLRAWLAHARRLLSKHRHVLVPPCLG
jgi:hypothetical protein